MRSGAESSSEPREPAEPSAPIEPAEPAEPAEPIEPAEPAEPAAERSRVGRALVDVAPLRASRPFRNLWIGGAISGIGMAVTQVAVGLILYDITGSTVAVALVSGVSLLPMIAAGLWGGMLADAFDRRRVLIVSSIVGWIATASLMGLAVLDAVLAGGGERDPAWPFYVSTTIMSIAATISMTTRSAAVGRILPAELVSRATALNGISFGIQLTVGPALAGVLVAAVGFPLTFAVDVVLFTAGFLGILSLPKLPPLARAAAPGLRSLRDGAAFLRDAPNIRMTFVLDLIAMTFGRPYAVLPAVAAVAIGGGPVTVGVLTAAGAIGTFLTGLFSGPVSGVNRHGVAIERAIIAYGGFVVLFGAAVGLSAAGLLGAHDEALEGLDATALAIACLAMAGMGASDQVSSIFRSTMLITAAPDEMRGRMQGVFTIVVTGGPRLGDLFAGIVAAAVALWVPAVVGGLLIIALVAVIARLSPGFRRYDARTPTL